MSEATKARPSARMNLATAAPLAWECYRQARPDDELTTWDNLSIKAKSVWCMLAAELMEDLAEDLAAAWDSYRRIISAVEDSAVLPWELLPHSTRQTWRIFLALFVEQVTQ